MDKDKAVVRENTGQLQRSVEKAVKSGLYFDIYASSDDDSSENDDDQPMDDAQGSAEVSAEADQPTEELSAPAERERAEGE